MAEKALWKWLKNYVPQGHYTRVENPDAGPGTSDVNYVTFGKEGWIELKDVPGREPNVPFPNIKKGLRKTQLRWIPDHVSHGGIVWIAARVGTKIYWVAGKHASCFNGATLKRLRLLATLVMDQNNPGPSLRQLKRMLMGEGQ